MVLSQQPDGTAEREVKHDLATRGGPALQRAELPLGVRRNPGTLRKVNALCAAAGHLWPSGAEPGPRPASAATSSQVNENYFLLKF